MVKSPSSSVIVSLVEALNRIPLSLCGRQVVRQRSLPVKWLCLIEDMQTWNELIKRFLRITLMSGLLLLATGRALLMSSKEQNASRDGLV